MKRSTIVRNETVSDEISFADSFYLLLSYCRGISLVGKGKKSVYTIFWEKFMVSFSRKKISRYCWFLSIRVDNLFYLT